MEHKNIHEAILGVMHEIGYVQKTRSDKLGYSYAGEAALIRALRPVMIEHGIYAHVKSITPHREQYKTKSDTTMNATFIQGIVRFTHAPSDTHVDVAAMGEGADVGDKSANKAATGLLKYALRQTFLIETGDDPDEHDSKDMERKGTKDKPSSGEVEDL